LLKTFAALGGIGAVGRITTGAIESGQGGALSAGVGALQSVPLFGGPVASLLGLTKQKALLEGTTSAVAGDLREFARYGIDTADIIDDQIDIRAAQQSRMYDLEKQIRAKAGQSREVLRGEGLDSSRGESTAFEKFAGAVDTFNDALGTFQRWVNDLPLIGGNNSPAGGSGD
jgi:hypothetical protein